MSARSEVGPSPGKKRKLNFAENLIFWKIIEGNTCSQNGPTISAASDKYLQQKQEQKQDNLKVVMGRDDPGENVDFLSEIH